MTVTQVVKKALLTGLVMTSIVAIVAAIVGALVADLPGMLAALVGAAIAFALLGLTPLSIMWGFHLGKGDVLSPGFFASVLGTWLVKFVVFLAAVFWLGDQQWLERTTLFLTIVVALLVGLVTDLVVVARSRMPYVSDVSLPGDEENN
ncbi:MAG: fructose-specific phosphotransferase system IIC component [Pontimonas sp.]|jgi:fructose-specific phosphotransferase system IIC component